MRTKNDLLIAQDTHREFCIPGGKQREKIARLCCLK